MTAPPLITVCVPVYNSAHLVGECLASLAAQTHGDFRVVVSVDPSTDDSLGVCRRWEVDPRFTVIGQPARLGWPGNINWLLERVVSPRLCIILHDDWVQQDYLHHLSGALDAAPNAAIAYGDLEIHSERGSERRSIEALIGDPCTRVCVSLAERRSAIEWRGLIRTDAVLHTDLLQPRNDGFAADVLWLVELAAHGDFIHVPQAVYHKRMRSDGLTGSWLKASRDRANARWAEHAAACFHAALSAREWTIEERERIAMAAAIRAIRCGRSASPVSHATLVQILGDFALRIAGVIPHGSPVPVPGALDPALTSALARVTGRPGDT